MKCCAPSRSTFPVSFGIMQLARAHRAYAAALLRELDLFPSQELMIMSLGERGPQPQSELVKLLGFDHSTVAKSMTRMEAAGWIARCACEGDRRAMMVWLTKKGEALQKKIEEVWSELERASVAELSPDQQKQLVRWMARVEKSVADAAGE